MPFSRTSSLAIERNLAWVEQYLDAYRQIFSASYICSKVLGRELHRCHSYSILLLLRDCQESIPRSECDHLTQSHRSAIFCSAGCPASDNSLFGFLFLSAPVFILSFSENGDPRHPHLSDFPKLNSLITHQGTLSRKSWKLFGSERPLEKLL